jgi:hypothetical protein
VPKDPMSKHAVIGVWAGASRRKVRMIDTANVEKSQSGPWGQVSRLGNPLFNEVIVPLSGQRTPQGSEYRRIFFATDRYCFPRRPLLYGSR